MMEPVPAATTSRDLGFTSRNRHSHILESVIDLVGGTAGGIANVYVGQPLDTVKVKMQTFPGEYRNALHCFRRTLHEGGVARGLYAGTAPNIAANVAENAILFVAYGLCQKSLAFMVGQRDVKNLSVFQNAVAGSCASFFSALALCPTELVKCRLQAMAELRAAGKLTGHMAHLKNVGPSTLVRHILRHEGLRGLFQGLQATIFREMPGYFFFFGGYEASRMVLTPPGQTKDDLSSLRLLLCGGIGGLSFWVSVFPTDVVKSRIQVESNSQHQLRPNYFKFMYNIFKEEGIGALYKGLGPTLLRSFFSTAALFLTYENTKQYLSKAVFKESMDS